MIAGNLISRERLGEFYDAIEPDLFRYPASDPAAFRRKVDVFLELDPD
jgi:hypothetical protein